MPTPDPAGDFYDWTRACAPERPYVHAYHRTWVTKFFLADKRPGGRSKVFLTFEGALDVIRRLDALSLGCPKIVYLVGWQFDGHDSKYPSWDEANPRLAREGEPAVDSLRWLMREAKRFHTTVSLHVNMIDAFADSPLWDEYVANDVIAKDVAGNPLPGEVFGSPVGDFSQSYQISYAREWEAGLAQRRIDRLLATLPIAEAGTIHIDAFHSHAPVRPGDDCISPLNRAKYGHTIGEEIRAQRRIIRYFRDRGVDVTAEGNAYWLRRDPFVGLQPMAWHFTPLNGVPPQLQCGTPAQIEQQVKDDPEHLAGVREAFCTRVAPWLYWSDDRARTPNAIQHGNDWCVPAPWADRPTMIAYSGHASTRTWKLPETFGRAVDVAELSIDGPQPRRTLDVVDGAVELTLTPAQGVCLTPSEAR